MFLVDQVALGDELRTDWAHAAWDFVPKYGIYAYTCFVWGC